MKMKRFLVFILNFFQEYDFKFVRDFDQKLVETNYPIFIELRKEEGGAFYNNINSKIVLKKKRVVVIFLMIFNDSFQGKRKYEDEHIEKPTLIKIKKRSMTEEETAARENVRETLLFE